MRVLAAADHEAVAAATGALDAGELVIVPGDLRYFIVADALDDDAVQRVFDATHRSSDMPLTAVVSGYADLHHVAYGGPRVREIADAQWPGPITISLKARPWLPDALTAGSDTVRVYAPRAEVTNAIARAFGPLAAASARVQGDRDSLSLDAARARLAGHVAVAIDGGVLPGGEEAVVLGVDSQEA